SGDNPNHPVMLPGSKSDLYTLPGSKSRSTLFTLPINRAATVTANLPTGQKHIPRVDRFNGPPNPTTTDAADLYPGNPTASQPKPLLLPGSKSPGFTANYATLDFEGKSQAPESAKAPEKKPLLLPGSKSRMFPEATAEAAKDVAEYLKAGMTMADDSRP